MSPSENKRISFWEWLLFGSSGRAGFRKILDNWLWLHFLVGVLCGFSLPVTLKDAGTTLLLPVAGVFIGLSFAWGGNALSLLGSKEIQDLSRHRVGGIAEYLYTYQLAILMILATLVLWSLAGLGYFDRVWPERRSSLSYKTVSAVLFSMASLTLRECWHVVVGSQWLMLIRHEIAQDNEKANQRYSKDIKNSEERSRNPK